MLSLFDLCLVGLVYRADQATQLLNRRVGRHDRYARSAVCAIAKPSLPRLLACPPPASRPQTLGRVSHAADGRVPGSLKT
eukprot:CAMPEP_0171221632 /NCGR_PEP_ID=MMETSP0790-20130122/34856_1 /TAXON_ID=2925 /ORGANISM="Alexandrium catenella, Strain OF101" /LENGTH=79 /DNA_ID=CAMNT_0011687569 /DNA_START=56 /DNA_END=291 /DNA_ORIENTATION=+